MATGNSGGLPREGVNTLVDEGTVHGSHAAVIDSLAEEFGISIRASDPQMN